MKFVTAPPLSHQAAEMIRKKIESGELKAGERLKPIRTLAEELSLGRQVIVSAIDILEKKGMVLRKEGCAVFVKDNTQTALRIGLYLEKLDFNRAFHAELLLQINEAVEDSEIIPGFSGREKNIKIWAAEKKLDGIIASGDVCDETVKKLKNARIPFVIAGNYKLKEKVPLVVIDWEKFSFEVFDSLIRQKKIKTAGAICGPRKQLASREIENGVRKAFKKNSMTPVENFFSFTEEEDGFAEMEKFRKLEGRLPDAIYVSSEAFDSVAGYILSHRLEKSPLIIKTPSSNKAFSKFIDISIHPVGDSLATASLKLIQAIIANKNTEDVEVRLPLNFEFIKK